MAVENGEMAPVGTRGAIVEVLNPGEAYLVELFGSWVKYDQNGNFIPAYAPEAFRSPLGIEWVYPQQLKQPKSRVVVGGIVIKSIIVYFPGFTLYR
jgi:hypothetical protein